MHLAGANGDTGAAGLGKLALSPDAFLLPQMNIKLAAQFFEQSEHEALAVVDNEKERHVIGLLTEAHVLRRDKEELRKGHREPFRDWAGAG